MPLSLCSSWDETAATGFTKPLFDCCRQTTKGEEGWRRSPCPRRPDDRRSWSGRESEDAAAMDGWMHGAAADGEATCSGWRRSREMQMERDSRTGGVWLFSVYGQPNQSHLHSCTACVFRLEKGSHRESSMVTRSTQDFFFHTLGKKSKIFSLLERINS